MKCDLCNEPALHIHSRCHITAPLRVEIEGNELKLYCYLPECNRHIATYRIESNEKIINNDKDWNKE